MKHGRGKGRVKQRLQGGPYSGANVFMNSPGTLPIRIGKWRGHYNDKNQWVSAA